MAIISFSPDLGTMLYGSFDYQLAVATSGCFTAPAETVDFGPMAYCTYLLQIVIDGQLGVKPAGEPWQHLTGPAAWLLVPGQGVVWRRGASVHLAFVHFTVCRNPERDEFDFNTRFELNLPERLGFVEPGPQEVWGRSIGGELPAIYATSLAQETVGLIRDLDSDQADTRVSAVMRLEAILLQWITTTEHGDQEFEDATGRTLVDQVMIYLDHMGDETAGVTKMADKLGVDSRSLSYHFRNTTGRSLEDAIIESRLARAAKYLTSSKSSIPSIASLAGYSDSSGFRRMFKQRYGCTPTQYRRRHWLK